MSEILEALNEVDWSKLSHAYGPATNIPDVLRTFAFGSNEERQTKLQEEWWGRIIHQGTYSSAVVAVVPFLVEIALAPTTVLRHEIIGEIHGIAEGYVFSHCRRKPRTLLQPFLPKRTSHFDDQAFVLDSYHAIVAAFPQLRDSFVSNTSDEEARIALAFLLSTLVTRWQDSLQVLLDVLDEESRPEVRTAIMLAISDLLFNCANQVPKCTLGYNTVLPRFTQWIQENESRSDMEKCAALLCILESGENAERGVAIQMCREFILADLIMPEFRERARGNRNLLWDVYESLWNQPDDQLELIQWALRERSRDLFEVAICLIDVYCRANRNGPAILVPELVRIIEDKTQPEYHEAAASQLVGLGQLGLETARGYSKVWPDVARRLESFESTLRSYACEVPDALRLPLLNETELLAMVNDNTRPRAPSEERLLEVVVKLGELPSVSEAAMKVVESATRHSNHKICVAALKSLHQLTGDHRRTVQAVLENWEQDFISIPMLKLLAECGNEATYLVPELQEFVESKQRYVESGWISGNCWLDEKMVAAAEQRERNPRYDAPNN